MLTNGTKVKTVWDLLQSQEGGALDKLYRLMELCKLQTLYYDQDGDKEGFGVDFAYTADNMRQLSEEIPGDLEECLKQLRMA